MALTINPAGSGSRTRWLGNASAFLSGVWMGALLSAGVALVVVDFLSLFLTTEWLVLLFVLFALLAMARDVGLRAPVPYRTRQVPEWWRSAMPLGAASFGYGSLLGFGFAAPFSSSTHALFVAALPFVRSPLAVLSAVILFGLGKTIVLTLTHNTHSESGLLLDLPSTELRNRAALWVRRATSLSASLLVLVSLLSSYVRGGL
ncbi:MAG: hypothetical protein ACRDI0_08455 [Actinomycetota bacterium]